MIVLLAHVLTLAVLSLLVVLLCGVVNLLFRKPYFDQWTRTLGFGLSFMGGGMLFDHLPSQWRLPLAVGGGVFLIAVILWLGTKRNAVR